MNTRLTGEGLAANGECKSSGSNETNDSSKSFTDDLTPKGTSLHSFESGKYDSQQNKKNIDVNLLR